MRKLMILGVFCVLTTACSARNSPLASSSSTITVVSYNIRHGRGTDEKVDLVRTAEEIRRLNAHFVSLQEVDNRVNRSGSVAQADSLGRLLGMHGSFGGFFPYQGGHYGMAVLSRFEAIEARSIRLPDGNEPRIALLNLFVLPSRDTMAVVDVHFDWVSNDSFRFAQAEALVRVLDTLRHPYIVVGDFNDTPESRTLAVFRSRGTEATKPRDNRFTFSSVKPEKEIDHLFAVPSNRWIIHQARVVSAPVTSDHLPVQFRVELRPVER